MRPTLQTTSAINVFRFSCPASTIFSLLILLSSITAVNGQSLQSLVPSVPTSPQAAAFNMYGDYAVNASTGTPDISIPLYEINHRGYKMPLALKYAARPVKPGYNYDVFGLGWAIPVTGSISRSIEYVPDEWRNFTLEVPGATIPNFNTCGNSCITDYNFAHDKFNVVLPNGSSFEFIIDNFYGDIQFKVSDGRQVKIAYSIYNSQIEWFTIIDEQGVKYTFNGADTPRPGYASYHNTYVSWQLSRIDLPWSTEPILFAYELEMTPFGTNCAESSLKVADYHKKREEGGAYVWYHDYNVSRVTEYIPNGYKMRLLTSITYGTSRVDLTYKNQNVFANSYQIDQIKVRENFSVVKEITFTTTMHGSNVPCYTFPTAVLDKVSIKGANTSASPMEYQMFNYSLGSLTGIDHWGNLNTSGADLPNYNIYAGYTSTFSSLATSAGLTPVTKETYDPSPFYKYKISLPANSGSDCRKASGPSTHGVLNRIKYPTGGYTDFEFENHKYLTSMDDNGNFEFTAQDRTARNASSFRIKTITSYASDGVVTGKKNYRYGTLLEYGHTGWGEPVADPNLVTYLSYANYYVNVSFLTRISTKNMVLGLDPDGQLQPFSVPFVSTSALNSEWAWVLTLSAGNFRRLLSGRQQVYYPEVTVYEGDIDENNKIFPKGKTVYKYKWDGDYPGETFFEPTKEYGNTLSFEAKPYYYNRLVEKTDYVYNAVTQQFKALRKEESTYTSNTNAYLDYQFGSNYLPESLAPSTVGDFAYGSWPVSGAFFGKPSYQGISLPYDKRVTEYTDQGEISNYEFYLYNSRAQLTRNTRLRSDGRATIQSFIYPEVISGITPPPIIEDMVSKNMIAPVIETNTSIYPGGGTVAGGKVEYAKFGPNQSIMPSKSYEMEVKPSGVEYVLRNEAKSYSENGNPLELISLDNFLTAHIWGYNDRYMVADVKNASPDQIAYSSFEDNTKGNWTYNGTVTTPSAGTFVPTGKKYYNLASGNEISKAVTNARAYVVAYWRNAATPYTVNGGSNTVTTGITVNGWTYFEHRITTTGTTISISGTGGIDEVRLFPAGAQMTTYTYDPLIGLTSQSNESGRTAYYVYDSFGRLSLIRDQNNNILKKFCYNYQNQPEDCSQ